MAKLKNRFPSIYFDEITDERLAMDAAFDAPLHKRQFDH